MLKLGGWTIGSIAVAIALTARAATADSEATTAAPEPSAAPSAAEAKQLDPKAVDVLKAASRRLAAAKTMSFTATAEYESPSRLGPPLVYATVSHVALKRPDKLRIITPGDGPPSEFYYDGKEMMAYSPAEDLVAVAPAPPTIDGALRVAYESAAIYFPFTDVVVEDPYRDLEPRLRKVFYIGRSKVVGGTTTDVVGIVTDDLFGQMWIGADDKLPRAYRVTYLDDPSRLRQAVAFSDWKLDGKVDDAAFRSANAAKAKKIAFARPDPQPPAAKPSPDATSQPQATAGEPAK
ncbi:MAG TPA: DUF2092 domain-containing protein [Candidatus Binatia bacterium]|nr:DUF2092 domain-containing protein [Candidatus Binatia bacterium]